MSSAEQLRLGESVVRSAANCTATFAGGTLDAVYSNQPANAALGGHVMQGRVVTIRCLQSEIDALEHPVEENTPIDITSDLPNATGSFRVAETSRSHNTGTLLIELKK